MLIHSGHTIIMVLLSVAEANRLPRNWTHKFVDKINISSNVYLNKVDGMQLTTNSNTWHNAA